MLQMDVPTSRSLKSCHIIFLQDHTAHSQRRDIHLSFLYYIVDLVLRCFFSRHVCSLSSDSSSNVLFLRQNAQSLPFTIQWTFSLILGVVFPKLLLFIGAFYLISILLFCFSSFVHTISIRLPEPELKQFCSHSQSFCRFDYLGNTLVNCLRKKKEIFFPLKANYHQFWTKWCWKQTFKFVLITKKTDNWWKSSNINKTVSRNSKFESSELISNSKSCVPTFLLHQLNSNHRI